MMEILLLAVVTYLVIITIGYGVHKYLQMPWMFTVVVLGMILSSFGLFKEVMEGQTFHFLAKMGMLFFLFTIGIDLELGEIRKLGKHIVVGNITLTLVEGFAIALFLYFLYPTFVHGSFFVALLCGIAFGTVGEVVLLAILKEFGLEKTRFGQLALGIGVFDDVFEILAMAIIVALPAFMTGGSQNSAWQKSLVIVLSLAGLVLATFILSWVGKAMRRYVSKISSESFVIPFSIFLLFFAFIYFGSLGFENLGIVAAIFSGIAVNQALPEKLIQQYKKPIFFVGNMFLGPFFFLSLGGSMSLKALASYPVLIVSIMAISIASRVLVSYLLFHGLLGKRQSVVMGIGLTAKFSTSVISENLLFTLGLVAQPLYTAIMVAYILLKPIIVGVFSRSLAVTKDIIQ